MRKIKMLFVVVLLAFNCSCLDDKKSGQIEQVNNISKNNHYDVHENSQINSSKEDGGTKANSIKQRILEKKTKKEQLSDALYELDHYNPFIDEPLTDNLLDDTSFLLFTMDLFETFLVTEESFMLTESDYRKISEKIKIFETENGRIYTYNTSALLYGNSGRTSFVYWQIKHDNEIKMFKLHYDERKDVTDVVQPSEDKNLVVLVGNDRNQQGWRAFIDGFYYHGGALNKINVLKEYQNDIWFVDTATNTIYIKDNFLACTYIKENSSNMIKIESGNEELELIYNNDSKTYEVNLYHEP